MKNYLYPRLKRPFCHQNRADNYIQALSPGTALPHDYGTQIYYCLNSQLRHYALDITLATNSDTFTPNTLTFSPHPIQCFFNPLMVIAWQSCDILQTQ